ncbi:Enoyl-[acyl-carrier-protein] reductase [Fusarium oxysporum f. sp. cubense]|uniref:Enoyl-[acyl-carrier-protein] reductase n=1 Tax=Fusarium oxysporum f. sp. cubense TaxID=61366 RepID=A0A559KKF9_FUSOC|nr:Enoyl-[acyl-carrier-protein] reductase [Fusarium oxysporum f. sp. cubense]
MLRTIVQAFGPPDQVVVHEPYEPQVPGPRQVRIQILLASINPSDLVTISGAYRSRTPLPFVPGFEGVGVIESVGPGVSELLVGQRVLPLGSAGAWQDMKVTEERWCFPVPPDLTDHQAAMAYINPLTAWMMVQQYAPVTPAAAVVVNAATSAISQMIIRMLNRAGVRPIALVRRSDAQEQLMGQLGVSAVLCTSTLSDIGLQHRLLGLTGGRGLAVAWDAVGGPEGDDLAHALYPGGTLVHYGLLSGTPLSLRLRDECPEARIILFRLRDWVHATEHHELQRALDEVFQLIRNGTAASRVAAVFPLSAIRQALECEATPGRQGKVLISISRDAKTTYFELGSDDMSSSLAV